MLCTINFHLNYFGFLAFKPEKWIRVEIIKRHITWESELDVGNKWQKSTKCFIDTNKLETQFISTLYRHRKLHRKFYQFSLGQHLWSYHRFPRLLVLRQVSSLAWVACMFLSLSVIAFFLTKFKWKLDLSDPINKALVLTIVEIEHASNGFSLTFVLIYQIISHKGQKLGKIDRIRIFW